MVTLTRKLVRQDVVARLKASTVAPLSAVSSDSIFDSRSTEVQEGEGTLLLVDTADQRDDSLSAGTPEYRITCSLRVQCVVKLPRTDDTTQNAALDAQGAGEADDLGHAVKETLFTDPVFVAQFERPLSIITKTGFDAVSSRPSGVVELTFDLTWFRTYTIAASHYAKLLGVDIETDIDPPTGVPNAEQTINLPGYP